MSAAKKPPTLTHDSLNHSIAEYAQSLGASTDGITTSCCAGDGAPMMLVGYSHLAGEARPFDDPSRMPLINALQTLNIKPNLVFITDLVKYPIDPARLVPSAINRWVDFLFDQIAIAQPRAVVLLGLETAVAVLRSAKTDIDDFRYRRYVWPQRTKASFFVTHPPGDLHGSLMSVTQLNMHNDIKAVAEADELYYDRLVPVVGFAKPQE